MAIYRTLITVTSGGRKLAPGVHEFSKETGDKLVSRGFAKEVAAPAELAAPVAPVTKGRGRPKAVKHAEEAESEASEGEAQAEPAEQVDGA